MHQAAELQAVVLQAKVLQEEAQVEVQTLGVYLGAGRLVVPQAVAHQVVVLLAEVPSGLQKQKGSQTAGVHLCREPMQR